MICELLVKHIVFCKRRSMNTSPFPHSASHSGLSWNKWWSFCITLKMLENVSRLLKWKIHRNVTYFSMAYPNSKKRFDVVVFNALQFQIWEVNIDLACWGWNWRTGNRVYDWLYSHWATHRQSWELWGFHYLFQRRKNPCYSLPGAGQWNRRKEELGGEFCCQTDWPKKN